MREMRVPEGCLMAMQRIPAVFEDRVRDRILVSLE